MEQREKPKKSLGQNFLRDPKILSKIADFADIKKEDVVIEVGPGEGTLTKILLERAAKVIAVEKDEGLASKLKEKFEQEISNNKLQILIGDILEIENLLEIAKLKIENYVLVGNIPYYITGAIFKKFLEEVENKPKSINFVVQKEVAERIMAKDGKESILSISIKAYGEPKYSGVIKAGSFFPKPKVDSAIISVRNISAEKFSEGSEKKLFEILKLGFAHKRKLLIKNLESVPRTRLDTKGGEKKLKEIFDKLGIHEKARAEELKIEDWINLTREF